MSTESSGRVEFGDTQNSTGSILEVLEKSAKANRLNPLSYLSKERHLPNLFDILMNSLQVLQFELGNFKAISADVRIHPDLAGYTMEFIEKGAEAAELALPDIRRIIAERLSATHT